MAVQFITYTTVDGDRWDLVAQRMYGDPANFAGLIAANAHVAIEPVLPVGSLLSVPVIPQKTNTTPAPPWSGLH
jgi:phage tail protein X